MFQEQSRGVLLPQSLCDMFISFSHQKYYQNHEEFGGYDFLQQLLLQILNEGPKVNSFQSAGIT